MELVRKIGLWIVAAVVAVAAGAAYFTVISGIGKEVETEVAELETRKEKLSGWARKKDEIPNREWINAAKDWADRVNEELDNCALSLAVQPLDSYRRSFYREERVGVDNLLFHEINTDLGDYEWTQAYAKHCATLQSKIDQRPGSAFQLQTQAWPTLLPTPAEMTHAMEMFWVQKEVADRLSDLVERDLNEMLAPNREAGVFPTSAADLVLTRGATELDEPLRLLDQAKLVQVTEAILLNEEEIDLATIFDKYLANPAAANDFSWARVYSLTTSAEQKRFLSGLVGDPNDYFNRKRFVDFVMELRSVRYRTDVADLLEREGGEFAKVGAQLRNMTENDRLVLKTVMRRWNRTRLAQTIAAVVAIRNEDDYKIVRDNHAPRIAGLLSLDISSPTASTAGNPPGGPSGVRGRPDPRDPRRRPDRPSSSVVPKSENYRAWPVKMVVKIEFERIPVFMRRLLTSSMRFRFSIESITPEVASSSRGSSVGFGSSRSRGPTGPPSSGIRLGPAAPPAPSLVPPTEGDAAGEEELKVVRHYVTVSLVGQGYQFTPLREKFKDRLADEAREAPSPVPVPEPDAGRSNPPEGR